MLTHSKSRKEVPVSLREGRHSPNLSHKIPVLCRERVERRRLTPAVALTSPDAKNLTKSPRRGQECLDFLPAPTLCTRCVQLSQAVADDTAFCHPRQQSLQSKCSEALPAPLGLGLGCCARVSCGLGGRILLRPLLLLLRTRRHRRRVPPPPLPKPIGYTQVSATYVACLSPLLSCFLAGSISVLYQGGNGNGGGYLLLFFTTLRSVSGAPFSRAI